MKSLETNVEAQKVAALEAARNDLENRVRTLETIVTDGDRNLEERLRRVGVLNQQRTLAEVTGHSGTVRRIWITIRDRSPAMLRSSRPSTETGRDRRTA